MAIQALLVILAVLLVLLFLGVPISYAIAVSSLTAILSSIDLNVAVLTAAQRTFVGMSKFSLTAIPFFILAGNIMNQGGIAKRLVDFVMAILGKMPGALLVTNIGKGDVKTFNKPVFPKDEVAGVGFLEAPRGVLSHWIVIDDGKIKNYQAVVPTTWNAAPRNVKGDIGAYEACLLGNPVADPERPLEVLRTVHSFDPCLACAVHVHDEDKREVVQVKAL